MSLEAEQGLALPSHKTILNRFARHSASRHHFKTKPNTFWFCFYIFCPICSEASKCRLGILAQQHEIVAVGIRLKSEFKTTPKVTFFALFYSLFALFLHVFAHICTKNLLLGFTQPTCFPITVVGVETPTTTNYITFYIIF